MLATAPPVLWAGGVPEAEADELRLAVADARTELAEARTELAAPLAALLAAEAAELTAPVAAALAGTETEMPTAWQMPARTGASSADNGQYGGRGLWGTRWG
jgi:hypothetical protein